MYMPPEEKKPISVVTRWAFRLLMVVVVIFLAFLFVVNTISGTGDMQRSGLQQALSDVTGTKVNISRLTQFNVFPQFAIGFEGVDGVGASADTGFSVGEFTYAKSFWDWFLNNETSIQKFSVVNFKTNAGVMGPQSLEITKAGIVAAMDKELPYLKAEGSYGAQKFSARFDLVQTRFGVVPGYEIGRGQNFDLQLGDFHAVGKFFFKRKEVRLEDVTFRVNDGAPVTGSVKVLPVDGAMTGIIDFTAGPTQGQLTWTPQARLQEWDFKRLHLDQLVADNTLWHAIRTSWEELVPPVSTKEAPASEPTRALVAIETLEGALTGGKLQGEFLIRDEGLVGHWHGDLGDQGKVECGVLNRRAVSLKSGPAPQGGTLALNEKTGVISYKPATEAGKQALSADDIKRLKLDRASACKDLLDTVTP